MTFSHRILALVVCGCDAPHLIANGSGPDASVGPLVDDAAISDDASNLGLLAIEPPTIAVPAGRNQIFVASSSVATWSVQEPGGGSIDAAGMYIAPDVPGTYHIVASDGVSAGTATVLVEQRNLTVVTGGIGGIGNVDGVGDVARFVQPRGVAYDGAGTLYIADGTGSLVRAMNVATREVTTLAGGGTGANVDGVGSDARFSAPWGLAFDAATGTLYVSDTDNTIRAIDVATRTVTTLAGAHNMPGTTNGPGASARLKFPRDICLVGTTLYIVELGTNSIRTLDTSAASHDVALFAGLGVAGFADSTNPLAASFKQPMGIACTQTTLYVADMGNSAIRTIDRATGSVSTLVGSPTAAYADGSFATAGIPSPGFVAIDPAHQTLYINDWTRGVIRALDLGAQTVSTLVGNPTIQGSKDGVGAAAELQSPNGIATDGQTLWFGEVTYKVRAVNLASATVTTLAGKWPVPAGEADGTLAQASFFGTGTLAIDGSSNVFVGQGDRTVRTISLTTGMVSHRAGQSGPAALVDGGPSVAKLGLSWGLLVNSDGTLWEAGSSNAIRELAADGSVTTRFGTLGVNGTTDQVGTSARFYSPSGLVRVGGRVIVADLANYTIRAIDTATGAVTTLAGSPGVQGGDDGIGAAARFGGPYALATDGQSKVWIGDWGSGNGASVRELDLTTGLVTTIAGTYGVLGDLEDGIGAAAHFSAPYGLAYDGHGCLYVADTGHDRFAHGTALIRRIWIKSRAVSTYAGFRGKRGAAPGPLQSASLADPVGLALAPNGDVLVTGENAVFAIVKQ